MIRSVRGGYGLGDALYVQSVARYLVQEGHMVEACVAPQWADVFIPLRDHVRLSDFRRDHIDILAHYSMRRCLPNTTQWEDVCIQSGIPTSARLQLDWKPQGPSPLVTTNGRPLVLVQMPRAPFGRADGYGVELLPRREAYQAALDALWDDVTLVQVGAGEAAYPLQVHVDMANRTTIGALLDLAYYSAGMVGYVSFMVPLAESLCRPALMVWARGGLSSQHVPVRQITPQKVLHYKDLFRTVYDDADRNAITAAAHSLRDKVRCSRAA